MKLSQTKPDKGSKGDTAPDHVHMPWDAAMAGLASGAYDLAGYPKDARDVDLPAAQSPAPGTDPINGSKETAADGDVLTNMTPVVGAVASGGLPTSPAEVAAANEPAKADAKPDSKADKKA